MSAIEIYDYSELALAAYANVTNGPTGGSLNINALRQNGDGMTQTQAEQFALRWPTVIQQYTDPTTGLSVTA